MVGTREKPIKNIFELLKRSIFVRKFRTRTFCTYATFTQCVSAKLSVESYYKDSLRKGTIQVVLEYKLLSFTRRRKFGPRKI